MNKKTRKLIRHPLMFLRDALRNVGPRIDGKFRRAGAALRCRYTIIIPLRSGKENIDRCIRSWLGNLGRAPASVQIIIVDATGGGENSQEAKRIARRYGHAVGLLQVPRSQAHEALPLALKQARGDWVSIVDADDSVAGDYLKQVDALLVARAVKGKIGIVCTNALVQDVSGRVRNTYPLRSLHGRGDRLVLATKIGGELFGALAPMFFQKRILQHQGVSLAQYWYPALSDVSVICMAIAAMDKVQTVALASKAHYHIAKDRLVPVMDDKFDFPAATAAVKELAVSAMEKWQSSQGNVPAAFQRHMLYALLGSLVGPAINREEILANATEQDIEALREALVSAFTFIDAATVERFRIGGITDKHALGALGAFKGLTERSGAMDFTSYEPVKTLLTGRYFSGRRDNFERFDVSGTDVIPTYAKHVEHRYLGFPFVYERIVCLALPARRGEIRLTIGNVEPSITVRRRVLSRVNELETIVSALVEAREEPITLSTAARMLVHLANRPNAVARYADAWIFMDRTDRGDDSAEHLYRYVRDQHPEINAYFVVEAGSEFDRLVGDGCKVLKFGSLQHKLALLNAKYVLSSHAASFAYGYLPKAMYGNTIKYRFVFLQHGVILGDLSKHFNGKNIDLFVTSSSAEHASIAGDGSTYDLTERQLVLSGLPRHDRLIEKQRQAVAGSKRTILFAPTWRRYLVSPVIGKTARREAVDGFFESDYAVHWFGLLRSPAFHALLASHGFTAKLFLHPAMEPYRDRIRTLLPHVELHDPESGRKASIQDLFVEASLMVTDYSSVAFDMAVIGKPVVYYQFDAYEFLESGAHTTVKGYFDFERDGFGPVCYDEDALLAALSGLLSNGAVPSEAHAKRMRDTFAHHDGKNCERTFRAVMQIDEPIAERSQQDDLLVDLARNATAAAQWMTAVERWRAVAGRAPADQKARAEFHLTQALLYAGYPSEALGRMEAGYADAWDSASRSRLHAEALTAMGRWREAASAWGDMLTSGRAETEASQDVARVRLVEALTQAGEHAVDASEIASIEVARLEPELMPVLGMVHVAAGNWSAAIEPLEAAVRAEPASLDYRYQLALAHFHEGGYALATRHVNALLKVDPAHENGQLLAGRMAAVSRKHELVVRYLQPLVAEGRLNDPDDLAALVSSLRQLKRAAEANETLARLAETDVLPARLSLEYLKTLYMLKNWEGVVEHSDRVLALPEDELSEDEFVWSYVARARAQRTAGDYAGSYLTCLRGSAALPAHKDLVYNGYLAALQCGRQQEVEHWWRDICRWQICLDPSTEKWLQPLTQGLLQSGDLERLGHLLMMEATRKQLETAMRSPRIDELIKSREMLGALMLPSSRTEAANEPGEDGMWNPAELGNHEPITKRRQVLS